MVAAKDKSTCTEPLLYKGKKQKLLKTVTEQVHNYRTVTEYKTDS